MTSAFLSPPLPPGAPSQAHPSPISNQHHQCASHSATTRQHSTVPLVPQIAPWTQYMRQPGKEPVLPSIVRNTHAAVHAGTSEQKTQSVAVGAAGACVVTKRHNPYAPAKNESANTSAITSPALQYSTPTVTTGGGKSPTTISFDTVPSSSSNLSNNNSITNYPIGAANAVGFPNQHSNANGGAYSNAYLFQEPIPSNTFSRALKGKGTVDNITLSSSLGSHRSAGCSSGVSYPTRQERQSNQNYHYSSHSSEAIAATLEPMGQMAGTGAGNIDVADRVRGARDVRVGVASGGSERAHAGGVNSSNRLRVTTEELLRCRGSFLEMAFTAHGSVFLQSAIRGVTGGDERDGQTAEALGAEECLKMISNELLPGFSDLLLDPHGCYIVKSLMERMAREELQLVVDSQIAPNEALVSSLCTHSLHTRRVVQFLFDAVDCSVLIDTVAARCYEIATTQQGCIVVQRAVDASSGQQRRRLVSAIRSNFNAFCFDPFANYVLQHVLITCDPEEIGREVWPIIKGNIAQLSCDKFASNVVEKCISRFPLDLQHDLLREMYDVSEEKLLSMLQDSYGNYIVQSSIALAAQREIPFMRSKLLAVLDRAPYGHKIETKLDKRRKVPGKAEGQHTHPVDENTPLQCGGAGLAGSVRSSNQQRTAKLLVNNDDAIQQGKSFPKSQRSTGIAKNKMRQYSGNEHQNGAHPQIENRGAALRSQRENAQTSRVEER